MQRILEEDAWSWSPLKKSTPNPQAPQAVPPKENDVGVFSSEAHCVLYVPSTKQALIADVFAARVLVLGGGGLGGGLGGGGVRELPREGVILTW